MSKDAYHEVDERIVEAVRSGKSQFYVLDASLNFRDFRTLDRRLQALRKRGVLTYTRKTGWCVAKLKGK
jgi:hypothetical protein